METVADSRSAALSVVLSQVESAFGRNGSPMNVVGLITHRPCAPQVSLRVAISLRLGAIGKCDMGGV